MAGTITKRESSWELLRIFAMLAIIFGHLVGQSGFLIWGQPLQTNAARILCHGGRIAVNIFFIMAAWFMVDARITGKRILSFYLQVWTYTALITGYIALRGYPVGLDAAVASVAPFITKAVWFASAYLILLFLAPFLNSILDWKRERQRRLLIVLFAFQCIIPTLLFFMPMDDNWGAILGWVCFIYLLIGHYKKFHSNDYPLNKWLALGLAIGFYALSAVAKLYLSPSLEQSALSPSGHDILALISKFCGRCLDDYKTLPNLLIALLVFYFFRHLNIGNNRIINFIATGAFASYIVHQTPAAIPVIWRFGFQCNQWIKGDNALLYALLVPLAVLFVSIILEWLRKQTIERLYINSSPFKYLAAKIDRLLGD